MGRLAWISSVVLLAGSGAACSSDADGDGTGAETGDSTQGETTGEDSGGDGDTSPSSADGDSGDGDAGDGTAGDGDAGDGDTGGDGDGEPEPLLPEWDPADFNDVYDVGPDHPYPTPSDVPWETMGAGSLVRIHYRAEPYTDKWVINVSGTEADPVVVVGIPEGDMLPVVTGDGASTRQELNYWNEERSVIKIGGSSIPDNPMPSWVYVQQLRIRDAHPDHDFTNDGGAASTYASNAASVHVESGENIHIYGCEITDSGNGIFAGSDTTNMVIRANHLWGNGISDSIYEHNSYTEALGITFEYNHYEALCDTCPGNNLKDRSAGTVIRHNWIEDGNRQLDLVDSGHTELIDDASYTDTFVYGNVLVENDGQGNSQMVHYGGDSGDESRYRKGSLHLYNNTLVSTRSGNTTTTRLSSDAQALDMRNNVVWVTANGSNLAITDGSGTASVRDNWLPSGWANTHNGSPSGTVEDLGNVEGSEPGFVDADAQDFRLDGSSAALDAAGPLADGASGYPLMWNYEVHQSRVPRPDDGAPDLGAYEAD